MGGGKAGNCIMRSLHFTKLNNVLFLQHSSVLHSLDSSGGPSCSCSVQVFPLFFGEGLVQVLDRRLVPPPQVAVHSVHSVHSVYPPSISKM